MSSQRRKSKSKSKSKSISTRNNLCSLKSIKFQVGQTYHVKTHFIGLHQFLQVNTTNKKGKKCKLVLGAGMKNGSGAADVLKIKDPQFVLKIPDIQYLKCHKVMNDSFKTRVLNQCAGVHPSGKVSYKGRLNLSKIKVLQYILKNTSKKKIKHIYMNNVYYYNIVEMPFQFKLLGAYFPSIKTHNCRTFLYLFHTKPKDILEVIKTSKIISL